MIMLSQTSIYRQSITWPIWQFNIITNYGTLYSLSKPYWDVSYITNTPSISKLCFNNGMERSLVTYIGLEVCLKHFHVISDDDLFNHGLSGRKKNMLFSISRFLLCLNILSKSNAKQPIQVHICLASLTFINISFTNSEQQIIAMKISVVNMSLYSCLANTTHVKQ